LPEYLLKDLETTVFVALSVSLSSISLIPNYPEHVASAAAIAVAKSDIPPLIKCRIFLGILDGLSQQSDSNVIASSVEQFLTDVSVEVCRSARSLTTEFFPFLETALLDTVLHSSPVISLVAQDIWCFLARYGSADLCWQYVTLLGNAIVCLAERYEAGTGPMPPRAPLRQLSRLGNLLSRLTVFLTARQQVRVDLTLKSLFLRCATLKKKEQHGKHCKTENVCRKNVDMINACS
uniref:Huntingtin n=1 Tax=Schistocephalus solidus TaxID=70667 RepID=A0A183TNI6_SCHSO